MNLLVKQCAEEAYKIGYEYFGVQDHKECHVMERITTNMGKVISALYMTIEPVMEWEKDLLILCIASIAELRNRIKKQALLDISILH